MDPVQRGPHDAFRAALWRGRCAEDFYPFLRGDDATWCSAGVYAGQWVEREAWNFPGPFYSTTLNLMSLAACDASGDPRLGGGDEPRLILYAPTGSTVEWLWRQPATDAEVRCVLLAMTCDEASSYACDGNRHWNLALVREWWANREPIRSWALHMLRTTKDDAAAYTRGTKGATDHAALRALLAYYDGPARDDLRQYAFFLSEGRLARAGEPLPEV